MVLGLVCVVDFFLWCGSAGSVGVLDVGFCGGVCFEFCLRVVVGIFSMLV